MDVPRIRHANLGATEDAIDLDGGLVAIDIRVAQVEFGAAKYAGGSAAPKGLTFNAAFDTSKDRGGVEHVWAEVVAAAGAVAGYDDGRFHGAPHENEANRNNRH